MQSAKEDHPTIEVWQALSRQVHRARHTPSPSITNPLLQSRVEDDPDGPLAPALLLWAADNLLLEARYEEAIAAYDELGQYFPDRRLQERAWAAIAQEKKAVCYERLGLTKEAVAAYEAILERDDQGIPAAWSLYRIGEIVEFAGDDQRASEAYRQASQLEDEPYEISASIPDLARRDLLRLESEREWVRAQPEPLSVEIAQALRVENGDVGRLYELASPTHFTIGVVNAERRFVKRDEILTYLTADLAISDVRLNPFALFGRGRKRYLRTTGWKGKLFKGEVTLLFTGRHDGWEWSGVGLAHLPDVWAEIFGEPPREENQPLELAIKAPWPAGTHFRAGGIIGGVASPCGFGIGGLYYNQPSTHVDSNAFAVDFSRSEWGWPAASGTPVLAVHEGVVTFVRDWIAGGSTSIENRVTIGHMSAAEAIDFLQDGEPLPRYKSRSLHLDGPDLIPVSEGMSVVQGSRLGVMDDTGLSMIPHLHFSIHDRDLGEQSVRPSPMDGQSLDDDEIGKCLYSTNVPVPLEYEM